ncbi:ferrous iron transport protein A [Candidatus Aerophobetes bacterium]|nr:ferrous iron transport protein A [Candidatus Aerophobetes bacterium]
MFTLLELPVGQVAKIVTIRGGWGVQRNLASLGFIPGKKVRKIAVQPIGGPVMVEIAGCGRVAIGRGMAGKVLVERETYESSLNG